MMKFIDSLVGPLHQNYCYYFYVLAMVFLLTFIMSVFACVSAMFSKKNFSLQNTLTCVLIPLQFLILYLINRIMFNMCRNSLN